MLSPFSLCIRLFHSSFNRYLHICHHATYAWLFSFRNSLLMIGCLWTLAFLLVLPNFIGWGDLIYDHKTLSCIWDRTADYSYTLFFVATGIGFPVTLISVCYLKIYLHVLRSARQVQSTANSMSMSLKERMISMRLSRTLFIIFVTFVTCWTPYALIIAIDVDDRLPIELHATTVLVAHINSCVNCILYGATNRQFRKGYIKFLRLTKCGSFIADRLVVLCCKSKISNDRTEMETQHKTKDLGLTAEETNC